MGMIKGQKKWEMFREGKKLTYRQAIYAMCYECNGMEESNHNCMEDEKEHGLIKCPLYQDRPHRPHKPRKKRKVTPEQLAGLKKAQEIRRKQIERS